MNSIADGVWATAVVVLVVGIVLVATTLEIAWRWVAYSFLTLGILGIIAAIWLEVFSNRV